MLRVEKLIPGGFGLVTDKNGKKGFLWNALPGEEISDFLVTKNKSSYFEGIATKIKNPSPYRVEEKDACFLSTSPWQIMGYDFELEQKGLLVAELFREHGIKINPPKVVTDGNDYFYRNKMEYALYYDHGDEKIHLAFHQRGSHRKVPIEGSSLENPEIFKRAQEIVEELNARGEDTRKYQSILLRANKGDEVSGGLYENHKPHPAFAPLVDEIMGRKYSYSPNGFFQINLPVYELALSEIKKYIATEKVLDLYAGVGTIGLSVAMDKDLTLVECDKSAYGELENNTRGSGARPVLAKSEEALDFIENSQTVILDPPRAGCDTKLIDRLIEVKPSKIIYLSCNPATQARDVKMLLEKYKLEEIRTFNFFPRTPHIENLVVLEKV